MSSEPFTMMSIVAKPMYEKLSFEEIRMQDYIKAYQSTGRPPLPCPQEPKDDSQRAALNLPPLFQGFPFNQSSQSLTVSSKRITDPTKIPASQEFRVNNITGERYQSISCMEEYEQFSHEELRYYAYFHGHKQPPTAVKLDPFMQSPIKGFTTAAPPAAPGNEVFESLCAKPQYDKHSPEELRISYLIHHRQLTSAEIFQSQNQSAPTSLTPAAVWPPASSSITPSTTSVVPPPIFASSSSSMKFTFGLP